MTDWYPPERWKFHTVVSPPVAASSLDEPCAAESVDSRVTVTRHPSRDVTSRASFCTDSQSCSACAAVELGAEEVGLRCGAVAVVTFGKGIEVRLAEPGRFRLEAA
jgi:hypothetical protein